MPPGAAAGGGWGRSAWGRARPKSRKPEGQEKACTVKELALRWQRPPGRALEEAMALLPWIVGAVVLVVVLLFFALWAFNYRKVGPNQVLVISGRTSTVTETDGRQREGGYRLRGGGGAV